MNQIVNALPIGTILDSGQHQYRIVKVLGQGGFGITYKAVAKIKVGNVKVDVPFAIKEHFISSFCGRENATVTIPNTSNAQEVNDSLKSFLVEAERLNRLSLDHDGLVKVNESFSANDTAYYVMEYIDGHNLRQLVQEQPDHRLSEAEAMKIFRQVAEAVSYLHDNQVTHLDIKPDNILLRDDGTPVLIDFGLAKHYDRKGQATSTLKVAGCSDGYSPLEQYVGIDHFTPEADVYALAATLLFMLTGKDPRKATEQSDTLIRESLPASVSAPVCMAITHSMKKLAENRTQSVRQLQEELLSDGGEIVEQANHSENIYGGTLTKVHKTKGQSPESYQSSSKKLSKSFPWQYFVLFLVFGLLLALIIIGISGSSEKKSEDIDSVRVWDDEWDEYADSAEVYYPAEEYDDYEVAVDSAVAEEAVAE